MRKYIFRGEAKGDYEELCISEGDLVFGQVVYNGCQPYIVGEVVESCEEYINLEFWIPIAPDSVELVGIVDRD